MPTEPNRMLSPKKLVLQVAGFAIGMALLVWCINSAVKGGGAGWEKLRHANPWLVAGLLGC